MVSRFPEESASPPEGDAANLLREALERRLPRQDFERWIRGASLSFLPPDRFVLDFSRTLDIEVVSRALREPIRKCARELFLFEPRVEITSSLQTEQGAMHGAIASREATTEGVREAEGGAEGEAKRLAGISPEADPASSRISHAGRGTDWLASLELLRAEEVRPSRRGRGRAIEVEALRKHVRERSRRALRSDFSFDSFVVVPGNRLAHAAALGASEETGTARTNPIFIHGPAGTGKTHLLQAACLRMLESSFAAAYFSADGLSRAILQAESESELQALKRELGAADVLIVEDLHHLASRRSVEELLIELFEDFVDSGRQVLFSSARAPGETPGLPRRILSRLAGGLTVEVGPGNCALAAAVLRLKAQRDGLELDAALIDLLAAKAGSDPREAEGAFAQLLNYAALHDLPVSAETAKAAFAAEPTIASHVVITIDNVLLAVQDHFRIKARDLLARTKARSVVLPRQIAMYLARSLTGASLQEIGIRLGGRDHTTVLYALKRIEKLKAQSLRVRQDTTSIEAHLRARSWAAPSRLPPR